MKLLRLKITDPNGFRSLQPGFEYHFRTLWQFQEEQGFAPFVCAGPNGSGKSNLLEALAAIFFQLELQRVRRSFLPEGLINEEPDGPPNAFELEYLIKLPIEVLPEKDRYAHVLVTKEPKASPQMFWLNPENFAALSSGVSDDGICSERERDFLLPQYVLGYSSGENEILSLPFFKMRFVQFDEYWNCLREQLPYPGRPETRLAYLDNGFSQAILLCNLLLQDDSTLQPLRQDVGVESLKEFRVIIHRSIEVSAEVAEGFGPKNPALSTDIETGRHTVNLMKLLETDKDSAGNFDPIVTRLKRCATCWFEDEGADTLVLDYWVNEATRQAFRENFDYEFYKSPLALFQALQVLLTLNLYSVSDNLKDDLYGSGSLYIGETVPILASDQRIMRFKHYWITKKDSDKPVLLKSLSDGEHQLLHSLGLCLLFRNTSSLFLLDEPETHFNPDWRSNFVTRLHQCFKGSDEYSREMLVTTHTPFLISDSKPDKVLVFNKDRETGTVSIKPPGFNTFGASINTITMSKIFDKRETIGGHAQATLDRIRKSFQDGEDKEQLVAEINRELGDSVEKVLLIKTMLDSRDGQN